MCYCIIFLCSDIYKCVITITFNCHSTIAYTKQQLNFVNASYLFTHISYLEKTYTTTAQEPSIYSQSLKFPSITKNIVYLIFMQI